MILTETISALDELMAKMAEREMSDPAVAMCYRDVAMEAYTKLDTANGRIAELEAQLAEANADAERNIGVLKKQLANCHETMRKDGIRHAKLLLAVGDDGVKLARAEADSVRLREILRDVWNQFATERPDGTKWAGGLSTLEYVEAALRLGEQPATAAEPQREHPKSCVAGSLGASIILRDGTQVCLVRGENAHNAHVWLAVRDAKGVYLAAPAEQPAESEGEK